MMQRLTFISIALLLVLATQCAYAAKPPAVASAHPLATRIGKEALQLGGNAFDAAVAVSAALAVVEPFGSGLGGGGFWLLHDAKSGRDIFIDGRETAPLAATATMYLDEHGQATKESVNGPKAAGIPGMPAALAHIATHYGTQPLGQLLAPAIRLAVSGVPVNDRYRNLAKLRIDALRASPAAAAIFLEDQQAPSAEFVLQQPDLARTLTAIARVGADGFYRGRVAELLVAGSQQAGGIWTLADLAGYQIIEREPIRHQYKGYEIVSAPLPSSGGIVLAQAFSMLADYDLSALNEVDRIHLTVEVMRRAYKTRSTYLGDEDFAVVPVDALLQKEYAQNMMADYSMQRATASVDLPDYPVRPHGENTTHFVVFDSEGNYVAATLSVNYPFGSGFVAPGTGVIFNNEMDDFAVAPEQPNLWGLVQSRANQIEPGKRMLSSMSPTFVRNDDQLLMVGTPGGSRIISMVLLAILDFVEHRSARKAVSLRRYHHQYLPDEIQLELNAFSDDEIRQLRQRGHQVNTLNRRYGDMHAIQYDVKAKTVHAASDPRGHGLAWTE